MAVVKKNYAGGEVNVLSYEERFKIEGLNDARIRATVPLSGLLSCGIRKNQSAGF